MSFLPADLQSYSSIISVILLLVDGFLFGVAAKKAVLSAILIIAGLLLAGFIGLSIPFISMSDVWNHVVAIFISQAGHIGAIFYTFPVFWIIGFAVGLWKG